jgi:hypothetical protein
LNKLYAIGVLQMYCFQVLNRNNFLAIRNIYTFLRLLTELQEIKKGKVDFAFSMKN